MRIHTLACTDDCAPRIPRTKWAASGSFACTRASLRACGRTSSLLLLATRYPLRLTLRAFLHRPVLVQFDVGQELCGIVVSVRASEDILSVWNMTCGDQAITSKIRCVARGRLRDCGCDHCATQGHAEAGAGSERTNGAGVQGPRLQPARPLQLPQHQHILDSAVLCCAVLCCAVLCCAVLRITCFFHRGMVRAGQFSDTFRCLHPPTPMRMWSLRHAPRVAWADLTRAFWIKYPNPHTTHVLSCDVVDRCARVWP